MCWKTMAIVLFVLFVSFLMRPSTSTDKEGFITYVVYGPGFWGGWGGPGGWPYGYRPYWHWRRRFWRGPCPGPWCPYF